MASLLTPPVIQFVRKALSGGATLSTTLLGYDYSGSSNECTGTYSITSEGELTKVTVDTFYIPNDPNFSSDAYGHAARALAEAYLESVRTAVNFRPAIIKKLARGQAVAAKISESWGDLQLVNNSSTILAGVTLMDASVVDDPGLHVIGLRFVFGKVAAVLTP